MWTASRWSKHTCSCLIWIGVVLFSGAIPAFSDSPGTVRPSSASSTNAVGTASAEDPLLTTLKGIASYARPRVGVDERTFLPVDHLRIDPASGLTYGRGMYTSASAIGPYLLFLLKVYEGQGPYAKVNLIALRSEVDDLKARSIQADNKTLALARILHTLDTIGDVIERDEAAGIQFLGGLLAWVSINPDGKAMRDKDLVPLLDNGILNWCYAAILSALEGNEEPLAKAVTEKIHSLLARQKLELFLDRENSRFFGEINVKTGIGNPDYYLRRFWTEDMLAVLWALLHTPMTEQERLAIWDTLEAKITEWKTPAGETIDVPIGYTASNHELIPAFLFLPIRNLPGYACFWNSQYVQADYAVRRKNPGFLAVSYDPLGAYSKMGIRQISEYPEYIQRDDCAVVYATAPVLLCEPAAGLAWLRKLVAGQNLLTRYGPVESSGPEGRADIIAADSQFRTAALLGGGVHKEILQYLQTHDVAGTQIRCIDFVRKLFARKEAQILKTAGLTAFRTPQSPFPEPPDRDYSTTRTLGLQAPSFEILQNLAPGVDDRHGANVFSPEGQNIRWSLNDDGMIIDYAIPRTADIYSRFAWWGTYLGHARPYPAGFTHVEVTVPNDGKPHRFNMALKREDTSLVKPIHVDSRNRGTLSDDGKWMTLTYPLQFRKRFLHRPLTYVSFSIDDPVRNPDFPAEDKLAVRSVTLVNKDVPVGQEVDLDAAIAKIGELPPYRTPPARPEAVSAADKPEFLGSGAVGEATEDISQESEDLIYFEFEDAVLSNGFAGVWTRCNDMSLANSRHLVFDVLAGPLGEVPNLLRVECKLDQQGRESVSCGWNVSFEPPDMKLSRDQWRRVVLPIPPGVAGKKFNMLNFIYENYMGGLDESSLQISSPALVRELSTQDLARVKAIRVPEELPAGAEMSLMPYWRLANLTHSPDVTAEANADSLRIDGKIGWAGARVYPSLLPAAFGDTLRVTAENLAATNTFGSIELKSGRTTLFKSDTFQLEPGATRILSFPLTFLARPGQIDFIAVSGIRGKMLLRDLRVSRAPEAATTGAPAK